LLSVNDEKILLQNKKGKEERQGNVMVLVAILFEFVDIQFSLRTQIQ